MTENKATNTTQRPTTQRTHTTEATPVSSRTRSRCLSSGPLSAATVVQEVLGESAGLALGVPGPKVDGDCVVDRSCWVKLPCGTCKREPWLRHFLANIVRNLLVGDVVYVTWRFHGQPAEVWRGTLVEKPSPTTGLVDYGTKAAGPLPLPPLDPTIRIIKVSVVKRWLASQLRHAVVGHFVSYSYVYNGQARTRVGVVLYVSENFASCKVTWFEDGLSHWIPAPKKCHLDVLKLRFYPPFTPIRGALTHAELQRSKRLRKLEVVIRPGDGSSSPSPCSHSKLKNHTTSYTVLRGSVRLWGPRGIIIVTWNCLTMQDRAKLDCLITCLVSRCVDAACLQETRRTKDSPPVDVQGWLWLESVSPDSNAVGGVAILLSPRLAKTFLSVHIIVPGRVMAVKLQRMTIICVYMPTYLSIDERQACFDAISAFKAGLPNRDLLALLGDFNSRHLNQTKRRTQPDLHRAARELVDFLSSESLYSQLELTKPTEQQITHKRSTLDYCLIPRRMRHVLLNYATTYMPIHSDHKMLSVRLRFRTPKCVKHTSPPPPSKPDFSSLRRDADLRRKFTTSFLGVTTYSDFMAAYAIAKDLIPERLDPKLQPSYKSDLVKALVMMDARLRGQDVMFAAADAHHTSEIERLVGMYTALLKSNPRLAWTHIAAMRPRDRRNLPASSTTERLKRFNTHFGSLFAPKPVNNSDPNLLQRIFRPQTRTFPFDTGTITTDEITKALDTAKSGKSPGLDDVPNEVLCLPELRINLLYILNTMYNSALPQDLRTSILIPLFKKGDLDVLGNWRGISLMPHITKLFNKILLNRLAAHIEPQLHWGQNGFRPDRGTSGHVMCMTALADIARNRKDFPLHGVYVDFSKAFDSITWEAIELALRRWNVPPQLIACVLKVMHGHKLRVRVDGVLSDDAIDVTLGVLQGDTLAPFLFIIVLDAVLSALPNVGLTCGPTDISSSTSFLLNVLGFADDLCLLAHTPEDVQLLFRSLQEMALAVGLSINFGAGKTERFHINCAPGLVSDMNGKIVPVVSHYKYLGVYATDQWKDLDIRHKKCWAALQSMKPLWKSNLIRESKRKLFYALIEPIMTYGIGAWPITQQYEDAVNGTFGRMLRFALNLAPVYISRHTVHTEDLYGPHPFITTIIRCRRMNFIAHAFRATCTERVSHPFIQLLFWEVPVERYGRYRGGQRITLQQSLLRDAHVEYVEQLIPIFASNVKTAKLIQDIRTEQQSLAWQRIHKRREDTLDRRTVLTIARTVAPHLFDNSPAAPIDSEVHRRDSPGMLTPPDDRDDFMAL